MITAFVGTPGSGKTYDAVNKIVDNLRKGRVVYTNIDGMDIDKCHEAIKSLCNFSDYQFSQQFHFLTSEQIESFWRHCKPNSLIVLDEIHKTFSNRDWQTAKNKQFSEWASTHRHQGYELVLITQDIEKVDSHVRSLIEWVYKYRKINFLGSAVQQKFVVFSYVGESTKGQPLAKHIRHYSSKIFHCYKSYVSEDIKEQGFMSHVNILRHPVFIILPIVLCFTLYMLFAKSSIGKGDLFGTGKLLNKTSQTDQTSERPPAINSTQNDSIFQKAVYAPPLVNSNELQGLGYSPSPQKNPTKPTNTGFSIVSSQNIKSFSRTSSTPYSKNLSIIYHYKDDHGKNHWTTDFSEVPRSTEWKAIN